MRQKLYLFLNRPIAEDFSFKNQIWQSLQAGLYVFLFVYFFGVSSFATGQSWVMMLAVFAAGCTLSTLMANWVVPSLLPSIYNEDRWTVWKYVLQTLFVLFCISVGNQLILMLGHNEYPAFWQMYLTVTLIGFFPIIINVFITEQRRLKRNLAHAQLVNEQLAHRVEPTSASSVPIPFVEMDKPVTAEKMIILTSDSGKERLSLQPDQLIYIESTGNYIEVYWLNLNQPQKTVLRNTLKDIADVLDPYAQFFRCHRAFLVNLNAISRTEGNARGYQLTVMGAVDKIPVSRNYLDAFDERLSRLL